eukprot:Hpha_TRINITY_DN15451_c2_g3::TRINITY_DN15451_c2_g3_i2::g.174844::m.174844
MPRGEYSEERLRRIVLIAAAVILLSCYLVWGVGGGSDPVPVRHEEQRHERADTRNTAEEGTHAVVEETRNGGGGAEARSPPPIETPFLKSWGYNHKRNVPRWGFLHKEIAADGDVNRPFSLVDYGSDEGFFSISVAKAFPRSLVIGVEMGGVGGSIWVKQGQKDVLKVTEGKIREHGVQPRVVMCQTGVGPQHFSALANAGARHDYQFVLSVFHWFSMPDRTSFEEVLVTMLSNAKTTFIELPIVGDRGTRFSKQVGWDKFLRWYDGRSDIGEILRDSLKARGVEGTVKKIGGVKWYPADPKRGETKDWMRETYRVDVPSASGRWDCEQHFKLYGCNRTTSPAPVRYSKCPDRD